MQVWRCCPGPVEKEPPVRRGSSARTCGEESHALRNSLMLFHRVNRALTSSLVNKTFKLYKYALYKYAPWRGLPTENTKLQLMS